MRVLVQRVRSAQVSVAEKIYGAIGPGFLLLVGIEDADQEQDLQWMADKIMKLRIMADPDGVMNQSILETQGNVLAISQFTLFASYKKGNRPSWSRAARAPYSQPLFEKFVLKLGERLGKTIQTGIFGADMQVSLINDGPVTLLLDSQRPE